MRYPNRELCQTRRKKRTHSICFAQRLMQHLHLLSSSCIAKFHSRHVLCNSRTSSLAKRNTNPEVTSTAKRPSGVSKPITGFELGQLWCLHIWQAVTLLLACDDDLPRLKALLPVCHVIKGCRVIPHQQESSLLGSGGSPTWV
jgi:hypothetical protein